MKCLKKITNLALANEWITKDPFVGIKFHEKEVIREFLTMDELLTIYHKDFPLERIRIVRDVFIFAAFTGLAFIDVQQLAPEHIVEDANGNLWICKTRAGLKTEYPTVDSRNLHPHIIQSNGVIYKGRYTIPSSIFTSLS